MWNNLWSVSRYVMGPLSGRWRQKGNGQQCLTAPIWKYRSGFGDHRFTFFIDLRPNYTFYTNLTNIVHWVVAYRDVAHLVRLNLGKSWEKSAKSFDAGLKYDENCRQWNGPLVLSVLHQWTGHYLFRKWLETNLALRHYPNESWFTNNCKPSQNIQLKFCHISDVVIHGYSPTKVICSNYHQSGVLRNGLVDSWHAWKQSNFETSQTCVNATKVSVPCAWLTIFMSFITVMSCWHIDQSCMPRKQFFLYIKPIALTHWPLGDLNAIKKM